MRKTNLMKKLSQLIFKDFLLLYFFFISVKKIFSSIFPKLQCRNFPLFFSQNTKKKNHNYSDFIFCFPEGQNTNFRGKN